MEKEDQINSFYAILEDNSVKRINLLQSVNSSIRDLFILKGQELFLINKEPILFDGNYSPEEDEVLYVTTQLPENVQKVAKDALGVEILNLKKDRIKNLFWFEDEIYYFQNFDNRKLLQNKSVIIYDKQTFTKLKEDAFILDNTVNAIYRNGGLYFSSYANANRIVSLTEFYKEASNEEIKEFSLHSKIYLDSGWFIENLSPTLRKHITLIRNNKILEQADTKKIKKSAKKFKLEINLDESGKIVFPNEKRACKEILIFLNEQYFFGLITGNKYKTNSKRVA